MANHGPREGHDPGGDAAAHHQIARVDEQRDRHQRKHADARIHPLKDDNDILKCLWYKGFPFNLLMI
jgi:hypothetical protein